MNPEDVSIVSDTSCVFFAKQMGLTSRYGRADLSLNILGFPHIGTALTAAADIEVINKLLGPGVLSRHQSQTQSRQLYIQPDIPAC